MTASSPTDRRDADDATFAAELARLDRLQVADVAADVREQADALLSRTHAHMAWRGSRGGSLLSEDFAFLAGWEAARAAMFAALKPAPGTDSSGQAVQRVLDEVVAERGRQDEKWGEQNHPDLSPYVRGPATHFHGLPAVELAKQATDADAASGSCSWARIAVEELAEAVDAADQGDEEGLRTEVIQLAAVCVQWAQAIDRRAVAGPQRDHGGEGGQ